MPDHRDDPWKVLGGMLERRFEHQYELLHTLIEKVNHMSVELDRLTVSVASLTTVATSAEALLGQLAEMIRALPADRAAINKLADDVDANVAGLSVAVTANTPAATP